MFHLVKDTASQIENNLLWVKNVRDSMFSWWFNVILLVVVLFAFGYFLYMSHGTGTPPELQKVKFEPVTWHNAVRNVPITEYGQIPKVENGDGVSGYSRRAGAPAI
uniref:Uncharacterized protein n=1 Tax=viral metagenome TaxID=1070528 RepID=A0A6C0JPL4_9ZZZZ